MMFSMIREVSYFDVSPDVADDDAILGEMKPLIFVIFHEKMGYA